MKTRRQGWREHNCVSSSTPMSRSVVSARRLLGALALLLWPGVALAHTDLRASAPAKNSRLTAAPTRLQFWFTARPQVAFSVFHLIGPGGEVPLGPISADTGNALRADITRPLQPGTYTVRWQTASADGHPVRGEFTFTLLGAASQPPVAHEVAPDTVVPSDSLAVKSVVGSPDLKGARWMEFIALLTVLGALGFRHAVLPPLASRGVPTADAADRARRLGQSVLVLYALAAVTRLWTEYTTMYASGIVIETGLLTQTVWGIAWLIGAIGALFVFLGWWMTRRNPAIGTPIALTGALGMVISPALSGHATGARHWILSVTLDMIHVAAAGLWIGGLLMVMLAGIPAMRRLVNGNREAAVGALVSSFHPLALLCAPTVVVAGVITSWMRVGTFAALGSTSYGQILVRKVVLVAMVAATGAYNAFRARRRLGTDEGTKKFKRTASAELVLAAVVLLVTTYLVAAPVPTEMTTPP